jgi:hypothetical protein
MRKPLSRICVVCCLIVLTASPLFASFRISSSQAWDDAQNSSWLRLDWGRIKLIDLPIPLPAPIVDIFNDGPDPVESSEKETEDVSEDQDEEETSGGGTSPFDHSGPGTTSGQRE